jgi:hypothetical protein
MHWYQWFALSALIICLANCLYRFSRLILLGNPRDYAKPKSGAAAAVCYSFTGAMNPRKKESAFLHLPTYAAGVLYHLGTFLCFFLFLIFLAGFRFEGVEAFILSGFLILSFAAGAGIFIKRAVNKKLRSLSNADDFVANALVTLFHFFTACHLVVGSFALPYYVLAGIILLYLPLGKLKHVVYFFAARYQLGLFYGKRGVWP